MDTKTTYKILVTGGLGYIGSHVVVELQNIGFEVVIIDDLIATGGTALACADLVHENFGVPKSNITVLAIIDLTDLGGFVKITEQGYNAGTLIEYEGE